MELLYSFFLLYDNHFRVIMSILLFYIFRGGLINEFFRGSVSVSWQLKCMVVIFKSIYFKAQNYSQKIVFHYSISLYRLIIFFLQSIVDP